MKSKNYLRFRNSIKNDLNLSLEEGYMLEVIFDYYNISVGYAYPSYEVLMSDLKTNRRAKVSKLLKSLALKGYIKITKSGRKNTYVILKYLFISESVDGKEECSNNKPVDSNGNKPVDGQLHIEEIETDQVGLISKETGFNKKDSKMLLEKSKNNVKKVLDSFRYVLKKGNVTNKLNYTIWVIDNNINTNNTSSIKINKFNNFKAVEYDYDALEKKLLGWDDKNLLDIYPSI